MLLFIIAQFYLADSLYENNHFNIAYIEYQRTFFLFPELKDNPQKKAYHAISLFHTDQYRGIRAFHDILQEKPDLDPVLKNAIARSYLDSGYAHQASALFIQTEENRLLGYTFLSDNRLYSARDVFKSINDSVIVDEIDKHLSIPQKSPRKAALLSVICPGAGEIYGGNTKLGIQDFLLNLGSGFLLYNAMKKKKYVDAALIFSLVFNRFYVGSIHNAQRSAQETNEKSREIWLDQMQDKYFSDLNEQTLGK
jgi:hypothetical protein